MKATQKTADLADCIDELHRIRARAWLLELLLIHNPEIAREGRGADAVMQQAHDVAWQLDALAEMMDAIP